jgi:hypothetical protein
MTHMIIGTAPLLILLWMVWAIQEAELKRRDKDDD